MNNTENPRNTQFAGFAKLLLNELCEASIVDIETPFNDDWREEWEGIIAHRAYDLVEHVFDVCNPLNWDMGGIEGPNKAAEVPDLTEWPEKSP